MAEHQLPEQYEEQHRRWYAEWIRRQYSGPGCRAKIVGRTKYEQIVRAVRGELRRAAENSKFRFWVRAKGFRIGKPASGAAAAQVDDTDSLYVVDPRSRCSAAGKAQTGSGSRQQNCSYKKVAVVDEFFDIIYRLHCSGRGISARHSGQKRTHRMIMETYAFLPREAVTAFLMGCPQCSTNNASSPATVDNMLVDDVQQVLHSPLQPVYTSSFYCGVSVENWSSTFACSTPVKSDGENYCTSTTDSAADTNRTAAAATGADKENVMDNDVDAVSVVSATGSRNKRKSTVPLKRVIRHKHLYQVLATDTSVVLSNTSTGSSTLRNSSSSTTLILSSSSSSCRTDNSAGVSKSSSSVGWWSKWGVCSKNSMRISTSSDMSGSTGHVQPLDLSSSPPLAITPTPPEVQFDDFFYKRRRVRRRRKPKRLARPCFGGRRADDRYDYDADDTSASEPDRQCDVNETADTGEPDASDATADSEYGRDDGPRPAKMKRMSAIGADEGTTTAVDTTETSRGGVGGSDGITTGSDELREHREKSAAMHSPINKRINGGSHHPYNNMHHNSRNIMNGLAPSSSSSLSKPLDTITSSSATHHNFHRHWLDMANESVTNSSLMDVDGSTEDNSMAAAAAAAAAALLFNPPSSVGGGISPGGPLSSMNPNPHLAHHHALSPLAPPPHSASSVGLTPAHHHHHQHIQQQLQQYAAAAVAAATAAAAAAAAASSAGDSTSPPPNLPLTLPPMAHHYNQNNTISGSNKRRSGGTGLTVQQQLYRRAGTPTSSATSSPSPRLLNSKNDADTTTSGIGLHENGNFSTSGPPSTTTTVLWPPLGLLTAAHHHSMSSPPKFQELFGSPVNSMAAVTSGSQVLPALPPPPISSPSSTYRQASKEINGIPCNLNVTGNDIGIGTGTGNALNADDEDPAIDDDDDEEDEEDEEEEEEDLDDDEIEDGEEYGDEDEDGERGMGDNSGMHARRLRRQQVRRLRQGAGGRNATNNLNDGTESGMTSNYNQHWQQPSNSTTSSMSLSKQQHQHSIGSSSQHHIDPERLKAFNMFVRLFVDENLDRQVPISRQPKDKVQAIIDSCGRQFPELSDRSRKRIRTYLKSCRRNKRNIPQTGGATSSSPPPVANPWPSNGSSSDPTAQPQRPTPAHLTSAQAETILAVACQRESDNARRMRLGLEPVAQPYPYAITPASGTNAFQQPSGSLLQLSQNGSGGGTMQMSSTSSDDDAGVGDSNFDKSSCHAAEADTAEPRNDNDEPDTPDVGRDRREGSVSAGIDPVTANNSVTDESNAGIVICGSTVTSSSPNSNETAGPTDLSVNKSSAATNTQGTAPMISAMPTPMGGGGGGGGVGSGGGGGGGSGGGYMQSGTGGFKSLSSSTYTTTVNHRRVSSNNNNSGGGASNSTGMLQLFPTMTTSSGMSAGAPATLPLQPLLAQTTPPVQPSSKLLNKADVVTVRQLIAGYRESAAFLLRSADELEHLLLLRG